MSAANLCIRLALPDDVRLLGEVHRSSVENLCIGHYSPAQIQAWFDDRPSDMYIKAIQAHRIWVATEHDKALGFLEIRPGEIEKLFVRGNAAGRGIGGELLRLGIERVRDTFHGTICALVLLNAQSFYTKHGFKKTGDGAILRGRSQIPVNVVRMELQPQSICTCAA